MLLYYRGVLPDFNAGVRIAVVGTRKLSDYGRKHAFSLSYDLAKSGATVVSGMAEGIDGVALAAALAADAPTVAVLGTGIDVCYPAEHLTLAKEIVKRGCVLTEYPPGTQPTRYTFPKRNRIISGLSSACLVIEGTERSGSLITARYAKEQGRLIYALPGYVGNKNSEAGNLLIKNGAKIVTAAEDIIRDFSDISRTDILNPFVLSEKLPVSMHEVLSAYRISCVAPSDDIFNPPRRKSKNIDKNPTETPKPQATESLPVRNDEEVASRFSKEVYQIYKKIPTDSDCAIESLSDSDHSLREVMRALLKLEMGRYVTLLPGERVIRKQ